MRAAEVLLLFANLLAFFVLAVPRLRAARLSRHAAPLTLLTAIVQVLVEGPRWQMTPAYVLSGLFFLTSLWRDIRPAVESTAQGRLRALAGRVGVGLAVLGLAVSAVLPSMFPVFRFAQPHGRYEIGTLTYHWVDAARPEIFTADPDDRRELMVQIWYPAQGSPDSPRARYVADGNVLAPLAYPACSIRRGGVRARCRRRGAASWPVHASGAEKNGFPQSGNLCRWRSTVHRTGHRSLCFRDRPPPRGRRHALPAPGGRFRES